ncbi:CcoQ/FixQ family Cbb3-type cytochrome c oxidase assembly chaperone [Sinomicrobium weinanense]|uniref:CcoQ/FixQ family Cbb3-type cytochrome c oxidase assembly chaperone n=1 Tax=Sinomicrobium weinanense TaxID=2842200 RepID=A0A926JVP2_9FLAO|nr:CcoQ/FixQ family Cbb3-type cytochrome c oxidase assembly chaperone [Sinomicrobium weinanense]MBC9798335.1 CcoQ/FixQ family Cbb3-type cytochrome c oxidase assembly chaperone [Sinomicrobium weinanense]MBU3121786.1 CcoQ/FixQ family Cbb3-type cytochrome c oxidase assembly chaperone [Sinomicrobium weinanense]
MLTYIKDHMASIAGIEIYPIISLSIFFLFFAGLFLWVFTARKEYIENVKQIPLEPEENEQL